jgi:hypothetical protein
MSKFSYLFQGKINKEHEIKTHGKLLKRNEVLNTWDEHYAVLSGGYLYFFKKLEDEKYSFFFNLNDAELIKEEELNNETGNKVSFYILSNKENTIDLMFPFEKKEIIWINALKESIYDMRTNYEKENLILRKDSRKEYTEDIVFGANVKLRQIEVNLIDHNSDREFTITLMNISLQVLSRTREHEAKFIIESLKIDAQNNLLDRKCIIYSTQSEFMMLENNNLIIIDISYIGSKSKKYENVNFDVKVTFGNMTCYWHPIIIENFFNYFLYTKNERMSIIKGETNVDKEETNDKLETCTDKKSVILKVNIKLDNLNLICIHRSLSILFAEFSLNQAQVGVEYYVDHMESSSKISNLKIYDLSNYPYKYEMNDRGSTVIKTRNIVFELKENSPILLFYSLYGQVCPCRDKIYNSQLKLRINSIKLYYYQEQIFRLYDYFFDDILYSVNQGKEVKRYLNSSSSLLKNNEDLNFTKMDITVDNPQIILKTRPLDESFFLIDLGNIKVSNRYHIEQGRIRNKKELNSWVSYFDLNVKDFNVTREDNFQVINPTEMNITFNTLMLSNEEKSISILGI